MQDLMHRAALLLLSGALWATASAAPSVNAGSSSHRHSLGRVKLPGQCAGINSAADQLRTQRALSWSSAEATLDARVWPEPRINDKQRLDQLKECARAAKGGLSDEQLAPADHQAEQLVRDGINQCLQRRGAGFKARSVVLQLGRAQCPS